MENFTKKLKFVKENRMEILEWKNTITGIQKLEDGFNDRMDRAKIRLGNYMTVLENVPT